MVEAAKVPQNADPRKELSWLGARLREKSTYAGLGTLLSAAVLFHVLPQEAVAPLVQYLTMFGIGVGGVIGVITKEGH